MPFIRVRGATTDDPAHEFDVDVEEVKRSPELYEVIDAEPVVESRPPKYVPRSAEGVVTPERARKTSGGRNKPDAPAGA